MSINNLLIRIRNYLLSHKYENGIKFDLTNGIDTENIVRRPLWSILLRCIGIKSSNSIYAATPLQHLDIIRSLENFQSYDLFIDVGCGKGRVLIYYQHLFKELIGIEFSKKLLSIAAINIKKIGSKNIKLIHSDASIYKIPLKPAIIYIFNPFGAEILKNFLCFNYEQIKVGNYQFIYVNPWHRNIFDEMGFECEETVSKEILLFKYKNRSE